MPATNWLLLCPCPRESTLFLHKIADFTLLWLPYGMHSKANTTGLDGPRTTYA
jgi:hypothetical protein